MLTNGCWEVRKMSIFVSKRVISLLIVAIFALSSTSLAESAKKTTITVLMPIGGGYTIEDQQDLAVAFEKEYPDVKVNMVFVGWDALWDKIVISAGARAAPDVIYIGSRWIPALADLGVIIPLDRYITPEKREMYPKAVWDTVMYRGETWGVVRAMSTKCFLYNKELFAKYGAREPSDWDTLLEAMMRCHNPPESYGIGLAGKRFISTVSQYQNYLYANGGGIVDEEGRAIINEPEAVEALEFYAGLAKYSQPSPLEWKREDLIELFSVGKIAMYIDHVHNAKEAMDKGIDVGIFMIPKGPKGEAPYSTIQVTDSVAISAQSKHKDIAVEFINFMTNLKNQAKFDELLGFIPPIIAEAELPAFQKWYWKPFIEVAKYGVPEAVGILDWEATQDAILTAIQKVLLGKSSADKALNDAARTINLLQGL